MSGCFFIIGPDFQKLKNKQGNVMKIILKAIVKILCL